jgi:hypothetical protein
MKTMEMFETHWADVHDLPVETLAQYRHATKDGYRLPGMASHYRTFCAALQLRGRRRAKDNSMVEVSV